MNKIFTMVLILGLFSCFDRKEKKQEPIKSGGPNTYKEYKIELTPISVDSTATSFSVTYFDGDKELNKIKPVIIYFAPDTITLENDPSKLVFETPKIYKGSVELMIKGSIAPQDHYFQTFNIEGKYFKIIDYKEE